VPIKASRFLRLEGFDGPEGSGGGLNIELRGRREHQVAQMMQAATRFSDSIVSSFDGASKKIKQLHLNISRRYAAERSGRPW